jgi:hypothetical protein
MVADLICVLRLPASTILKSKLDSWNVRTPGTHTPSSTLYQRLLQLLQAKQALEALVRECTPTRRVLECTMIHITLRRSITQPSYG